MIARVRTRNRKYFMRSNGIFPVIISVFFIGKIAGKQLISRYLACLAGKIISEYGYPI